jgi:hypothetical protein
MTYRLIAFISAAVLLCPILGSALSEGLNGDKRPAALEGAYEFVSEVTVLTEPADALPEQPERTSRRTAQEWAGLWLLQDGRFSRTMMKRSRPQFPDKLGYESSAGTYRVDGKWVEFTDELKLSPLDYVGYHRMEFRLDGDRLTLSETWHPSNPHIAYGGTRTIVLQRRAP